MAASKGPGGRSLKVRVRSARGRPVGSTRWLERQLNDPYVKRAKAEGYRSRSAFKLIELDRRFGILKPGQRVLDLGSAPGGWVQVAAARGCIVVGLDRLEMDPISGAILLQGDIQDDATPERLFAALGGPADVLLSDLAADATGTRAVDRLRAEGLGELVINLADDALARGGDLVIKLVRGADAPIAELARARFAKIRLVRPDATRKESSEIYLVGSHHRGTPSAFRPDPGVGDPQDQ